MFRLAPLARRPDASLIDSMRNLSPSTLGHYTDMGFIRGLQPNLPRFKMVGRAVTVRLPHLDSTALHYALDVVEAGDVVVVDQSGDSGRACWGGIVSVAAKQRGVVGAIVDGPITDVFEVAELGLPVYSRGVAAVTTRILGLEGAVNVPVTVGGVTVIPGDLIFGDENGVVALSTSAAMEWVSVLAADEAEEPAWRGRLEAGVSLAELSGAKALFEKGMVTGR
ncbi:MAG TPA: RraA family protein [Candidatus Micrarchaeia archaeon]|nr:RraA family protein [Candidatus Micrarchaeia archaeon]